MASCSNTLTSEQLASLEELAGLFMIPEEMAVALDVDGEDLREMLEDPLHPAAKAYTRGKIQAKIEIRRKVLTLAKMGSPPAQTLAHEYLTQLERHENG